MTSKALRKGDVLLALWKRSEGPSFKQSSDAKLSKPQNRYMHPIHTENIKQIVKHPTNLQWMSLLQCTTGSCLLRLEVRWKCFHKLLLQPLPICILHEAVSILEQNAVRLNDASCIRFGWISTVLYWYWQRGIFKDPSALFHFKPENVSPIGCSYPQPS